MIDHPIQPILKTLPTIPGIYMYKDREGTVLYVGKAKNLRKRVTSYFANYRKLTSRIQLMIDNAVEVDVKTVDTEVEALLVEANFIKKFKPRYNVLLKDDKSYSYIKITKDPYPIMYRTRDTKDKKASYFGPYTSGYVRDQIYNYLRREFPFRSCSYDITPEDLEKRNEKRADGERVRSRLCTFYHIGRCGGPCEGLVSNDEYNENIENVKLFLKNKRKSLLKELTLRMNYYAQNQEYEKCARIKQQIDSLSYVSKQIALGYDEDDITRLEFQRSQKGLEVLIRRLKLANFKTMTKSEKADYLDNFRIECYDISNIQGTNPVGAMVVSVGGIAKKSHYRKFKINVKETPDDFAMMKEMLTRRFRYIAELRREERKENKLQITNDELLDKLGIKNEELRVKSEETGIEQPVNPLTREPGNISTDKLANYKTDDSFYSIPDLIIIDGGKGQLGKAVEVLHDLKLDDLKVCGLAKRREEIFKPGEKKSYLFDDKQETLFLLQRIRDEAHRFGITYHRLRRGKAMLE